MPVEHIRLRRIRNRSQARVPQNLSVRRIVGDKIPSQIAREEKFSRGRQDSVAQSSSGSRIPMPPLRRLGSAPLSRRFGMANDLRDTLRR